MRDFTTNEMMPTIAKLQDNEHENLLRYYGMDMNEVIEKGQQKLVGNIF